MNPICLLATVLLLFAQPAIRAAETVDVSNARKPSNDAELRYWLESMIWHHRFSTDEIKAATGLTDEEITAASKRFNIRPDNRPPRAKDAPLRVLPYPGGRHPRVGFLEGAVRPQRETKVSVFTPWDDHSYVVVDVPEAIWSQNGLIYLAHTHVDTIWTKQGVMLEQLEWKRHDDGSLSIERRMPNGVSFAALVVPKVDRLEMELRLHNGSSGPLSNLRVQNCVMLKGAAGFNEQTKTNKVHSSPYVAARDEAGARWIITAWDPAHRAWDNPPVPCIHSDPKFPDCPPGESRRLRGWFSFYEGTDIEAEFRRIEATGWRQAARWPMPIDEGQKQARQRN